MLPGVFLYSATFAWHSWCSMELCRSIWLQDLTVCQKSVACQHLFNQIIRKIQTTSKDRRRQANAFITTCLRLSLTHCERVKEKLDIIESMPIWVLPPHGLWTFFHHAQTHSPYVLPYTTKSGRSRLYDVQNSMWTTYDMPLCRLSHGHHNHRKNSAKRKALTNSSRFSHFFAAQSISKLSRSPEFFRRDCKSLTKTYLQGLTAKSQRNGCAWRPQQPQQQPELFFFLLFLDFTAEPVFTAAAAELAGITKLALAISDIACPSWGAVWPSGCVVIT